MQKLLVLLLISGSFLSSAAQEMFPVDRGQALFDGYDPVSYFDGKQRQGVEAFAIELQGRHILFSSQGNLEKFKADSARYMPAYGGWCAIAMAKKTFIVPDYGLYKIQDGQLMFFQIRAFFNGLTEWNKNADGNKIRADTNYTMYFPRD